MSQNKNQKNKRMAGTKTAQGNRPQQQRTSSFKKKKQQDRQMDRRPMAAPNAISRPLGQFSPMEKSGKMGTRTIRYKEYVQDILGSVAFATTTFQCNPGLSNLFAWLSGQALFYQEYTVRALKFCFETEKATTLSGKVMFAFLQDSSDPAPASKQEMLENLLKAAGAIWQPFCLPISMSNFPSLGKSRFIRGGNLAANLDVKTYDIGALIVATQGMADASAAGELYVEYEIELRTPLQSSAQLANALSANVVGNTAISVNGIFGTAAIITGGLDISVAATTITFNKVGQYLLDLEVVGTGLFTLFNPATGASTATVVQLLTPYVGGISNAAANIGTNASVSLVVTVSARGQTVQFNATGVATSVTASTTRIGLYAAALV